MSGFNVNYQAGGRFDKPFMPTKKLPYIKGVRVEVAAQTPLETHVYNVTQEAEMISLAIACSRYEDSDYFNFYVNGRKVCDEVYTKELPEGLFFTVIIPLAQGDELKFEFRNTTLTAKSVWLNYQMLV